jgi:hypothetical protein
VEISSRLAETPAERRPLRFASAFSEEISQRGIVKASARGLLAFAPQEDSVALLSALGMTGLEENVNV